MAAPSTPPDLVAFAAEMRAQWRADEALWTQAAVDHWAHGRTFVEILSEYGARADRVAFVLPGQVFSGTVVDVGRDVCVLAVATGSVLLPLTTAGASWYVSRPEASRTGGRRLPNNVGSFRAALRAREVAGIPQRVGLACGDELVGTLVVGHDHLLVRDGVARELVVPLSALTYVTGRDAST